MKDALDAQPVTSTKWPVRPLGKVAKFLGGGTPSKSRADFWNGDIPWVSPKDMKSDLVSDSLDKITPKAVAGSAAKIIPADSLLIVVRSGILARTVPTALTGREVTINQDLKAICPLRDLHPRFLAYFMRAAENKILTTVSRGATVHRLSTEVLKSLEIPLPPLEEQKRIVAVLDRAFAALDRVRANAEANLADTSELFKSELRAAFAKAGTGVELLPFGSLCETITPKVKIQRKDYLGEGAYPIVSQEVDLVSGYCDDPDALMSIGEPVVIFGDHTRCLKYVDFDFVVGADGTKVLRPKKDVAAEYLYFGLRSQPIAETGYARHFKFIREISLPKLRHEDQLTFAHRLSEIESKCRLLQKVYETKLAALSALRQSLLRHAFSGRLTA